MKLKSKGLLLDKYYISNSGMRNLKWISFLIIILSTPNAHSLDHLYKINPSTEAIEGYSEYNCLQDTCGFDQNVTISIGQSVLKRYQVNYKELAETLIESLWLVNSNLPDQINPPREINIGGNLFSNDDDGAAFIPGGLIPTEEGRSIFIQKKIEITEALLKADLNIVHEVLVHEYAHWIYDHIGFSQMSSYLGKLSNIKLTNRLMSLQESYADLFAKVVLEKSMSSVLNYLIDELNFKNKKPEYSGTLPPAFCRNYDSNPELEPVVEEYLNTTPEADSHLLLCPTANRLFQTYLLNYGSDASAQILLLSIIYRNLITQVYSYMQREDLMVLSGIQFNELILGFIDDTILSLEK